MRAQGYEVKYTGDLDTITIYTLFDITHTGVTKPFDCRLPAFVDEADQIVRNQAEWTRSRNQQRNWETIVQLISLRAQPMYLETPRQIFNADAAKLGLGCQWSEPQTVWTFNFTTENIGVYEDGMSALGKLINESQYVPMITGLTETASITKAFIETSGTGTNTSFSIAHGAII